MGGEGRGRQEPIACFFMLCMVMLFSEKIGHLPRKREMKPKTMMSFSLQAFSGVLAGARSPGLALLALAVLSLADACAAMSPACDQPIAALYDRVSPAVVTITGQSINPYRLQDRVTHTVGSGFIADANGLVLTNSHVAFGQQSLTVTLDDGTILPARLLGADPIYDIAALEIPKPDKGILPTVHMGDSDKIRVGEDVIAVGNPLGLDQTVTRGIISGLNRILPDSPMSLNEPMIQTDASINPGDSGGPLFNRFGEVIGITTSMVEGAQNIGFAIPINLVKLLKNGKVIRPWLGFNGTPIKADLKKIINLPLVDGFLVEAVEPGSPAEAAGIRGGSLEVTVGTTSFLFGGDIVTSINGTPMNDPEKIKLVMRALTVGSKVKLALYREGKVREVEYLLPERPLMPGDLPEDQSFTIGPPRGNANAVPVTPEN
jgi:S1-C subfamily serine protease